MFVVNKRKRYKVSICVKRAEQKEWHTTIKAVQGNVKGVTE